MKVGRDGGCYVGAWTGPTAHISQHGAGSTGMEAGVTTGFRQRVPQVCPGGDKVLTPEEVVAANHCECTRHTEVYAAKW